MTIRIEVADAIGLLTLDDPDRRNTLNLDMVQRIVRAFEEFEADGSGVGAVVITGAPPAFCAGANLGDLGWAAANAADDQAKGFRAIYEGFLRVARSPLPTIAAVNGAAVGAGMNLALCCDVRLAARRARFITRFVELGLHPGGGHTWMLQRIVGPQTAAAMVLMGEVLDGEAAERAGLVWRCYDDDALLDEARALAGKAASGPPALVRRVKDTMRAIQLVDHHDVAVDMELEAQVWSQRQPFFKERLAALQQSLKR
jgi:enoyl-CoA hydratase